MTQALCFIWVLFLLISQVTFILYVNEFYQVIHHSYIKLVADDVALYKELPYKMKYWQEYYLAKCIEKHFNIGDLDEML